MGDTAAMSRVERDVSLAIAVRYAVVIVGGLLLARQMEVYLPHAILLGVCCVAVPSMLRSLRSPAGPTKAARTK